MLMRRRQNWAPCRRPAELLRWGAQPSAVRPERAKGEPAAIPQGLQPPTTSGVIAGASVRSCEGIGWSRVDGWLVEWRLDVVGSGSDSSGASTAFLMTQKTPWRADPMQGRSVSNLSSTSSWAASSDLTELSWQSGLPLGLAPSAAILGLPALSRSWSLHDTAQGSTLKDQPLWFPVRSGKGTGVRVGPTESIRLTKAWGVVGDHG